MTLPPHPRTYVAQKIAQKRTIDGDLEKPEWRAAPWTELFVDIEGAAKPAPRLATRAKMLWDDDYFYLAAWLEEPHVWATLTQHDSVIFHDNDFEVFIDPDGDNHDYGELELNALATTWDLRLPKPYRDGGPALDAWEIEGMQAAVQVKGTLNDPSDRDEGWSVELALPWRALSSLRGGARPLPGDCWRVNFSRVEWDVEIVNGAYKKLPGRPEHNWVWSPQGVIDMHRPERWGYVRFADPAVPASQSPPRDADWSSRCRLMALYDAQKAFFAAHGRWASGGEIELADDIALRRTPEGWEATLAGLWVRHDSLLTAPRTTESEG